MSYLDSPDFRRQANSVADSGLKVIFSALTSGAIAVFNFIKGMVMQAFGQ